MRVGLRPFDPPYPNGMHTPSTTHTDGLPATDSSLPLGLQRVDPKHGPVREGKVECNACPVLCQISEGRVGACDRYANQKGVLVRIDPVVMLSRQHKDPVSQPLVPRQDADTLPQKMSALASEERGVFVTGIGASTTYPDYKPAPFIVASKVARRGHGDRGHRRHLQLLQFESKD